MSNVEAYLKSRSEFERATQELSVLADLLATAANALRSQPDRFSFANTGQGVPLDAMSQGSVSINADNWKSPAQIMNLLANYHKAKGEMLNLWRAIPKDLQDGIVAPNDPGRPRAIGTRSRW